MLVRVPNENGSDVEVDVDFREEEVSPVAHECEVREQKVPSPESEFARRILYQRRS